PHLFGIGVAVDAGLVEADPAAVTVGPPLHQQRVEALLTYSLGYVARDHAEIDREPAQVSAERHHLPFDAVALAVDAERQDDAAGRDPAFGIVRRGAAITQRLPRRRFTSRGIGPA